MKYVAPSAEELARRGLNPDGTPLVKPTPKKPRTSVAAGAEVSKPTLKEGPPPKKKAKAKK